MRGRALAAWGLVWVHVWCLAEEKGIALRSWAPWVFGQALHYWRWRARR